MAGINLSQSIQEKQAIARGTFFDKGFFVNISIFLLVAALYGGSQWYLGTLEEELVTLQADSNQKVSGLKNPEANRAADMKTRLDAVTANLQSNPDPKDAFQDLERSMVPSIRVTDYVRAQSDSLIIIRGVTTNLRYLAQQMLSYKKIAGVASVHAELVKYNDEGQIEFELRLPLVPKSEQPSS